MCLNLEGYQECSENAIGVCLHLKVRDGIVGKRWLAQPFTTEKDDSFGCDRHEKPLCADDLALPYPDDRDLASVINVGNGGLVGMNVGGG